MCSMQLNYSKEAIDSEFDWFEITTECDWLLPVCPLLHLTVCKYILYVQQTANVCVRACVRACVHACVHGACVRVYVHENEGVHMFWSPCSIITIIFPFTSAPVNDDDVWELHTWESEVFMWQAAWDWVLKSVRFHGMHTCLSSRKQHRNTGADKREKVLIARVSRIIDQAALTLLPKGFAETVPWNCDYFTHTSVQNVSRVLRFQRKTPSVQTSFTQGNEDAKHCHIQTKKRSVQCVSWT